MEGKKKDKLYRCGKWKTCKNRLRRKKCGHDKPHKEKMGCLMGFPYYKGDCPDCSPVKERTNVKR